MAKGTKNFIIKEAKKLFNAKSYDGVTLHELANHLGMSRGNLAYHYKDKDVLLVAIVDEMLKKIDGDRSTSRQFPTFENLHKEVQLYYKYQKEYSFIFLNSAVMNHPSVIPHFRAMTNKTIQDNVATLVYSIKSGNLKPEPIQGIYNNIAVTTWMLAFFWLSQQIIRGERSAEDGEKMIWSILIPHFTDKGIQKFKEYFGEEYFNSLGESIEVDLNKIDAF
jgi:AcrR family transcriptional regulator